MTHSLLRDAFMGGVSRSIADQSKNFAEKAEELRAARTTDDFACRLTPIDQTGHEGFFAADNVLYVGLTGNEVHCVKDKHDQFEFHDRLENLGTYYRASGSLAVVDVTGTMFVTKATSENTAFLEDHGYIESKGFPVPFANAESAIGVKMSGEAEHWIIDRNVYDNVCLKLEQRPSDAAFNEICERSFAKPKPGVSVSLPNFPR